jgi:hypothetical protein
MAISIAEQIAVKVKTRLGLIDADDGYETTVAEVVRARRTGGFRPKDYQLIVTQGTITRNEAISCPGNPPAQGWNLPFVVAGLLRPADAATTPIDTLKNQFWADVVKALNNGNDWYNWDQLAVNSHITDVEDVTTDDSAGFQLTLVVQFRTDENDPYVKR